MDFSDHDYCSKVVSCSKYVLDLSVEAKVRYFDKLTIQNNNVNISIQDPYSVNETECFKNFKYCPQITYPDIFNYLTSNPGGYNFDCLKNYKSLSAYEYVTSGKVCNIMFFTPKGLKDYIIVFGEVQPSFRVRDANYKPWVLAHTDGRIQCGHCTCVAGLGETCSHVAALLFKIELTVRLGLNVQAPTETACQ
ncbi:uncharacterized protein [Parasteatoda tepidariorum]|uniref:uncharacterized protein n=1 Tax=Parasteatoda tepidariorum TaxID=114398 RepID=UPI0039BCD9AE